MLLGGEHRADDYARQAVLPLQPHQKPAIGHLAQDHAALPVGYQIPPVVPAGAGARGGDDLEVLGTIRIGEDDERVLPAEIGVMLHLIADARRARRDHPQGRLHIGEVDQMDFGGLMVAAGDEAEHVGLGFPQRHEEALVGFLIDENVGLLRGSQRVAEHL